MFDKFAAENAVKKEGEIWLAYCGTLGASYDLNVAIDAVRIINDKSLKFIIMGDGERREEFERRARGLNVVFTGSLPYQQMCGVLASCDITINPIMPGAAQSIINKHSDYAASGLPVINTQESEEYRNLVEIYQMGLNCESGNAYDVASKLQILCDNDELRTKMGRNARRCAEERFDRAVTYKTIVYSILHY